MTSWTKGQLLGFDLEATSADPMTAIPCSYSFVLRRDTTRMSVQHAIVDPGIEIPDEAAAIHGITTERARAEGEPLAVAMTVIYDRILWAIEHNIPIIVMNTPYDLTVVHRLGAGLLGGALLPLVIDIYIVDKGINKFRKGSRKLDALCEHYGVERPVGAAHDATSDAAVSILIALAIAEKYPWFAKTPVHKLMRQQARWRQQQLESLSEYFVEKGDPAIPEDRFGWPIEYRAMR